MLGASDDRDSTTRTTAAVAAPPPVTARATTVRPATTTPNVFTDEEISDLAFTMALDKQNIRYSSKEAAINLGHTVCDGREKGVSATAIALTIAEKGGYSAADSGYIVGAAQSAYCPEYK
ncbi:DUF732 domain-containing protein [Nocardia sp. NPDC060249]|uniref:DUF732 domain-containing protein n=1 Tax=Nocardia sp. NPDC060249 TaxID=3347082 RepID=UPI003667B3EB